MRLALVFAAAVCLLGLPAPCPAEDELPFAGRTLEDALDTLKQRGLKLVYTSFVVRPDMRVRWEPKASEPREILDQLLAPHGLTAREGPGGVLTILAGGEPVALPAAAVQGTVRQRRGRRPLPGVAIRLPELGRETVTAEDGNFHLGDIPPGGHALEASLPGYLTQEVHLELAPGETKNLLVELSSVPLTAESIDVTSSRLGLLGEELSTLSLERETLLSLPNLGEDVVRPLTLLPGTAGNDVSARFSVRGGRRDEVMVRLDRFEILEPYHLRDLDSALSILAPETIGGAELLTGGFPAEYGDRMGGVLDLVTINPSWDRKHELALNLVNARASSSGNWKNGGHYLASARGGLLELASQAADQDEEPRFWDVFGKIDQPLATGRSLRGYVLSSYDRFDFTESEEDDLEDPQPIGNFPLLQFRTSYRNDYLWLTHQVIASPERYVETRASFSRVKVDRRGFGPEDSGLVVSDQREVEVGALAQDWDFLIAQRHDLKWGLDVRSLDAEYDYFNVRGAEDFVFRQGFNGEQYAFYVSDRIELRENLNVELGLRFDRNSLIDNDSHLSPRTRLSYALGERSRLSAAWGFFFQSQRLYELQVEDRQTRFSSAERAEHRILGFEHDFGRGERKSPLVLRAEVYERRIRDPRLRFENLFDPISLVPELESDRIRIAPERGWARGVELLLGGRAGKRLDWFLSYTYSRTKERVAGRDLRRRIDQPHKVGLDLNYRSPWGWTFNLAWEYHTGWPTTPVTVVPTDVEPGFEVILGPLYGERLPDYSRFDLHVARSWSLRRGELTFYVDVQNVTNATNLRGFEVTVESEEDEFEVVKTRKLWGPLLPSIGLRLTF